MLKVLKITQSNSFCKRRLNRSGEKLERKDGIPLREKNSALGKYFSE